MYIVVEKIVDGIGGFENWKAFIEDHEEIGFDFFEGNFFGVENLE